MFKSPPGIYGRVTVGGMCSARGKQFTEENAVHKDVTFGSKDTLKLIYIYEHLQVKNFSDASPLNPHN